MCFAPPPPDRSVQRCVVEASAGKVVFVLVAQYAATMSPAREVVTDGAVTEALLPELPPEASIPFAVEESTPT